MECGPGIDNFVKDISQQEIVYHFPGDEEFITQTQVAFKGVNSNAEVAPKVVVVPTNSQQVSTIIKLLKDSNLPFAVKNGGHAIGLQSIPDGGVLLSLSGMKNISIDKENKAIIMGGGVQMEDVDKALNGSGFWLPLADGPTVGYTGYLLHGGVTHAYAPQVGQAADLLQSVTVVLANGDIVDIDSNSHPDLFPAMKGAGSVFGVVTSMTVSLIDEKDLCHDFILYDFDFELFANAINFVVDVGKSYEDVCASLLYQNVGGPGSYLYLSIAYNSSSVEHREDVTKKLVSFMGENCTKKEQGLSPLARLPRIIELVLKPQQEFLAANPQLEQRSSYVGHGLSYNYMTQEHVDELVQMYVKEPTDAGFVTIGYFHTLRGKMKSSECWNGLKNSDMFCMPVFGKIVDDNEKHYELVTKVKKFVRDTDGLQPEIYCNLDMIPFQSLTEESFSSFLGGEENIMKLKQLKYKYDPENFFKQHFYAKVFEEKQSVGLN